MPFSETGLPENKAGGSVCWVKGKGGRVRWIPLDSPARLAAVEFAQGEVDSRDAHMGDPTRDLKRNLRRFDYVLEKFGITLRERGATGHGLRHEVLKETYEDSPACRPRSGVAGRYHRNWIGRRGSPCRNWRGMRAQGPQVPTSARSSSQVAGRLARPSRRATMTTGRPCRCERRPDKAVPGGNDCAARHRLAACLTPQGLGRRAPCACSSRSAWSGRCGCAGQQLSLLRE